MAIDINGQDTSISMACRRGWPGAGSCFGAAITEADVRLWPTLARFNLSYNPLGKSERRLTSYPRLWG